MRASPPPTNGKDAVESNPRWRRPHGSDAGAAGPPERQICACKKPLGLSRNGEVWCAKCNRVAPAGTELELDDPVEDEAPAVVSPLELMTPEPPPSAPDEDATARWRNAREEVLRCRRVLEASQAAQREAKAALDYAQADLELASAGLEHAARNGGLR